MKEKARPARWIAFVLQSILLPAFLANPMRAQEAESFLMVKLGNEAANPSQAGDFLQDMGAYLQAHVPHFEGRQVRGYIANREQPARDFLAAHKPALAFVSPGFYLAHLLASDLDAVPVAQVPRFGATNERYYLVAQKDGVDAIEGLKGKTVRTHFSPDLAFLKRVVFPDEFQPGEHFTLEAAENLADEVFLMIEGLEEAADALLLDEELKIFFEEDDLVWPDLKVVWMSDVLPRDLVITLGPWSESEREGLREALFAMKQDAAGAELLTLMDSSGFSMVDTALLEQVKQQYVKR